MTKQIGKISITREGVKTGAIFLGAGTISAAASQTFGFADKQPEKFSRIDFLINGLSFATLFGAPSTAMAQINLSVDNGVSVLGATQFTYFSKTRYSSSTGEVDQAVQVGQPQLGNGATIGWQSATAVGDRGINVLFSVENVNASATTAFVTFLMRGVGVHSGGNMMFFGGNGNAFSRDNITAVGLETTVSPSGGNWELWGYKTIP